MGFGENDLNLSITINGKFHKADIYKNLTWWADIEKFFETVFEIFDKEYLLSLEKCDAFICGAYIEDCGKYCGIYTGDNKTIICHGFEKIVNGNVVYELEKV